MKQSTLFFWSSFIFFPVILLCVSTAIAAQIVSPEFIPGSVRVDSEGVIDLVNKIPDLLIIDARISNDRKQGYIEGSISLPDIDTNCDSLSKVIPKNNYPILFYCNGVKCGRSAKSVRIALQCGYNNIYWFRGGFEEWQIKGYPFLTE